MKETEDAGPPAGYRLTTLLDPDTLRRLLRYLEATDVDEIEMVAGGSRLFLRREPNARMALPESPAQMEEALPPGIPIPAPLTGVFYCRPAPEQAAYVEPGDLIAVGQVVALIETMKLFNEVTAELAGDLVSLVVRDGDLVEVGQPLMYVRPREEGEPE